MSEIDTSRNERRAMCKGVRKSTKMTAKMLADVIRNLAPVYEKHGKQIAGIVLPNSEPVFVLKKKG